MSNNNAIAPLQDASRKDLEDATGVMKFFGSSGWSLTISGLRQQGGVTGTVAAGASLNVSFNEGFPQQCMQVQLTSIGIAAYAGVTANQNGFVIHNGPVAASYMWDAYGT